MISNKSMSFTRAIYRNVAHNHRQFAQLLTNHQRTSQFLCANLVRLQSTGIVESAKTVKLHEIPAIAPQVTIIDRLPDVRITRRIVGAVDLDLVLFQYHTCPFCCKVRVFLDSQGISYSVVEVDAVLRQDTKWSSYKKVPMMLAKTKDGKYAQLTDSSAIVSIMTTLLQNPGADVVELAKKFADADEKYQVALSKNAQIKQEEQKWRKWTDSHLINLISPNVYGTVGESLATFKWFSKAGQWDVFFPRWERHLMVYSGAAIMFLLSKRLKKRHNLSDDVRSHMYTACNEWLTELKNGPFHGGSKPNLADLAVFGALNSFEGCQAFDDIKKNTKIEPWFNAVSEYIEKNKGKAVKEN